MSMYKLLEYSSNYSDTASILWFYFKDEETNFSANNADGNAFTFFKYTAKLLGNTIAGKANGILKSKKTKIRNAFANNMVANLKLSKARISKRTQAQISKITLGSWLSKAKLKTVANLAKKHQPMLLFILIEIIYPD